eukprot:scpid27267/ scgid8143/ 
MVDMATAFRLSWILLVSVVFSSAKIIDIDDILDVPHDLVRCPGTRTVYKPLAGSDTYASALESCRQIKLRNYETARVAVPASPCVTDLIFQRGIEPNHIWKESDPIQPRTFDDKVHSPTSKFHMLCEYRFVEISSTVANLKCSARNSTLWINFRRKWPYRVATTACSIPTSQTNDKVRKLTLVSIEADFFSCIKDLVERYHLQSERLWVSGGLYHNGNFESLTPHNAQYYSICEDRRKLYGEGSNAGDFTQEFDFERAYPMRGWDLVTTTKFYVTNNIERAAPPRCPKTYHPTELHTIWSDIGSEFNVDGPNGPLMCGLPHTRHGAVIKTLFETGKGSHKDFTGYIWSYSPDVNRGCRYKHGFDFLPANTHHRTRWPLVRRTCLSETVQYVCMRNTRTLKRAICSGFALYSHSDSNKVISHAMANEKCQNIVGMNLPTAEQWEGLKALAKTLPENNFGCKAMVDEYKDSGILRISDTGRKGKFLCFGCRPLVSQDTGINYVTPNGTVVCHDHRRPRRLASTTGAPYCVNGFWRNLDSCERVLVVKSHDILQMRTPNWTMDYRICRGHHYPWTMVGHVTCPGGHVWQCRTAGPNNVLIPGHECSRVAGKIYLPQCANNLWMNIATCYRKEVGFPDNYDRSGVDLEPRTATFKCKPDYFEQCSTPPCAGGRWNQAANFSGSPLRWDNLPNCRRFHSAECLKSRFQFTWSSTTYDRAAMACDSIGQVLVNERLFEKQYSLHQECLLQTLNGAVMWVRSPNGPMEYKFGRDSMPVPLPNANSEQTRLFLCMPAELMSNNDHCDDNAYEPLPVALLREAKDICSLRRGELVKDNSFFSARCLILFRLRTGVQDPYICHVPTHSHQPVSERTCSPRQGDRGKMLVPTDKKMDYFEAVHACKLWKGAPVQSRAVNERCFQELQNTQNLLPLSDPTKWHTYEQLPALQDAHLHRFFIPKHVVCWIPGEHVPRESFLPVDIPLFNSTVSVPFMHKVDWTTAVNECRFRGGYLPNTQAVDFWKTNVRARFDLGPKIDSIASNYHIMANATEQAQRKFVLCEIPKKYRDYDTTLVSTDCSRHTRLILPNVQPMLLGDAWRECKYWNGELVTSGVGGLDNCLQPFYGAIPRLQAMNVLWSVHDIDSIPEAPQQGLQKAYIPVCRVPIKYVRFWCAQT